MIFWWRKIMIVPRREQNKTSSNVHSWLKIFLLSEGSISLSHCLLIKVVDSFLLAFCIEVIVWHENKLFICSFIAETASQISFHSVICFFVSISWENDAFRECYEKFILFGEKERYFHFKTIFITKQQSLSYVYHIPLSVMNTRYSFVYFYLMNKISLFFFKMIFNIVFIFITQTYFAFLPFRMMFHDYLIYSRPHSLLLSHKTRPLKHISIFWTNEENSKTYK